MATVVLMEAYSSARDQVLKFPSLWGSFHSQIPTMFTLNKLYCKVILMKQYFKKKVNMLCVEIGLLQDARMV